MEENQVKPVEDAIKILYEHIDEIDRVVEWSQKMGYEAEKVFSEDFRDHFGKRPKRVMVSLKIAMAVQLLSLNHEMGCFEIAQEIGKKNEQALFHFLKNETGFPPTHYRNTIS